MIIIVYIVVYYPTVYGHLRRIIRQEKDQDSSRIIVYLIIFN